MRTVAVDILTGFLGSGKTTLLRHVLDHGLKGKRVAVIMNEIGEIGIDGTVVTGLSNVERMVELSSGCICCTIEDYKFDLAIQEILDTAKPHLVIIESTGLADPEPLAYRVKAAGLGLDAVITVVDAANVDRHLGETEVARAQVAAADFLVVNKLDLVPEAAVTKLEKRLARMNPRAERFRTVRGAIESDVLFATGVATYRELARQASDHVHVDGIGSFVFRSRSPLDQDRFERLLAPAAVGRAACQGYRPIRRTRLVAACSTSPAAGTSSPGSSCPKTPKPRPCSSADTWTAIARGVLADARRVRDHRVRGVATMADRRPDTAPTPPPTPPTDSSYTDEEEAEVQKRLEDLGYVE